jgi:tetratricopeptide (TPR) repeat protein
MNTESSSLVLEILKQDNHLAMSVIGQEERSQTVKHYSQRSLAYSEVNKLCREVASILNKTNKKGKLESDLIGDLKKTGQLLWDHLFTKAVKERLKNTQALDLVLSIDEELIDIPWELLYDAKDFLCLKFNLGRLVRTKEQVSLPQYRSISSTLRMLILANPTNDLESAYQEGIFIRNQFDRQRKQIKIDFKSTHIDTLYVKRNLRDYDIVHFAGHCEYNPQNPKDTGWILNDGAFSTHDILALGESLSLPSLVFANACHSAKVINDLMEPDYQEKTYSLAAAFLFSGVRHYIGAIRRIEDPESLIFAKEFYAQLIKGRSMGECIRLSRLRLIEKYGITAISWAGYILYGDPNFVILRRAGRAVQTRLKGIPRPTKKLALKLSFWTVALSACIYIYMWLPTINPNTYLLFRKSHSSFLKGNNQEAISFSEQIIKKEPSFLAIYPIIADAYQRVGKSKEALRYYFEYAYNIQKKNDKKELASAYIKIGWTYHKQGDYPKAYDFYNKATTLSRENKDKLNEAIALRKLAVWYMDKEDYDKAMELLVKSSEINRDSEHSYEHRYNLACDYFDMGLVFTNKDDFVTAKEFYQKSQLLFEKLKLKNELSDYYFNLGEICLFEKQYEKAMDYYVQGLKIDEALGDIPNIAFDYNMIGELYVEMGNLDKAEESFSRALRVSQGADVQLESAATYYNLGLLYKQKGQRNKARDNLRKAQEIYRLIDTNDYQETKKELLSLNEPAN